MSLAFHIIFAVVGIAMPVMMVLAERRWRRTGDPIYLDLAKRWTRGTAILFAVGAVSGTLLFFELGLLWPTFMRFAGAIIGMPFSREGFAFFTEAIFLGVYLYGWERVSPRAHRFAGVMVASARSFSCRRSSIYSGCSRAAIRRRPSAIGDAARDPPGGDPAGDETEHHAECTEQLIAEHADERRDDEADQRLEQPHEASRRMWSAASVVIPSTVTSLRRAACPRAIVTEPRGTPSRFAMNRTSSLFAAPFTGGAATRMRTALPCRPAT